MSDICGHCEKHNWDDNNWYHICLCADVPGEIPVDMEACERFRPSKRGNYQLPEHSFVIDMDELEGKVADDKYTRKGK